MLLNLIYGEVGTGKTHKCIEQIKKTLEENISDNAVLVVPDQYSYTTEKRVVEKLGGTGPNRIEVLTFSQFFTRYINRGKNYLTPAGKQMLFYTAINMQKEADFFASSVDKPGFVDKIKELVCEMKRYLISPEMLRSSIKENDTILSRKLNAFADIYESYNSLIREELVDSDDDFLRLSEFILSSDEFSNTHLWFDGFSDFLPQHYRVISAFLSSAKSVHISLCLSQNQRSQKGVLKTTEQTKNKLIKLSKDLGADIIEEYCGDELRTITSPEIMHLIKNWDVRNNVYYKDTEDILVFCARDLYSETENLAKQIIKLVKSGKRYRDIGVMCANLGGYSHLIEAIFSNYKIPYFCDEKQSVTEHPIILTVLAAFDVTEENWSYDSVFKYLRTGYIYVKNSDEIDNINPEDIDLLENYVLRHGIRGKSVWLSDDNWEAGKSGVFDAVLGEEAGVAEDIERINKIRKIITKPFIKFYEKTSGRRTVKELAEALYVFLCDINLYECVGLEAGRLNELGRRNEAERMKEIWNLLIETMDQTVVILNDNLCSKESFNNMLKAGLSAATMQIIPPGVDSVSIGSADRNSPLNLDIIFFLGAVSGTMPAEVHQDGLLTDTERRVLPDMGLEISGDSIKKAEQEMFKFYRSVSSASEKLFFSYPASDIEGESKQPAEFIKDLCRMFPKIKVSDNLSGDNETEVFNPREAFIYLMKNMSDAENINKEILNIYGDEGELSDKLRLINYAKEYKKYQPRITKESAKLLYNDYHRYSVSRLNDYSLCPFGYFIKHGLKAREQEIWQIQKFEIGSLLHWAVMEYCIEVENQADTMDKLKENWKSLTYDDSIKIINKIMDEIKIRVMSRLTRNQGRVSYLIERMRKILIRSCEIVRLSLSMGEYTAICYEEKFGIDIVWNDKKVGINGTIDRVDVAEDKEIGKIYLRVVDYKSGKKAFDVVSISNNTDMQLVVYAIAATELYKKGSLGKAQKGLTPAVGGILYSKLKDDIVNVKKESDKEELLKKDMKMDGLVVTDSSAIDDCIRMDRSLTASGGKSDFMKLAANSKGNDIDQRSSSTIERDKFDILLNYVKKTVVKIDDEIFSGNIEILPRGNKKSNACSYCQFKEICLYDARFDSMKKNIEGKDEAWAHMEE